MIVQGSLSFVLAHSVFMTGLVHERRAVHFVCLDFRKAFNTASHNILTEEAKKWNFCRWTLRWTAALLGSGGCDQQDEVQLETSQ